MRQIVIRNYDPPKGVSIASLEYEYPANFVVPEHAHGSDQLLYAVAGVMHVSSGRNVRLIPPQFAVWIPAKTAHSIRMPGAVSLRSLYLRPGLVDDARDCRVLHVRPMLRELILTSVRTGNLLAKDRVHAAIRTLIVYEIENASGLPTIIDVPEDARAQQIARRILNDPGLPQTVADLCEGAGLSVRTFQRIFRREIGLDFETWRQQARLIKGIELLVAGQSVKEVSGALGYSHVAPFISIFRNLLGVTPGVWIQTFRATR